MSIELKIRLKSPMVTIKNGMVVETHSVFPPGETSGTVDYGIKSIANNVACTISPFSVLGWLRRGVTEYLISNGISVCHNYDITDKAGNPEYRTYAEHDLVHGYHKKRLKSGEHKEKPECEAIIGEQCIVAKMFGGFNTHHRVFKTNPIKVSPVKSQYEKRIRNITGLGNFRNINISPRSAIDGVPFATHTADIISNLDAILYIQMYEDNLLYVACIMKGIEFLNEHRNEFEYQLGGSRTFGAGCIEVSMLPFTMTKEETTKYHLQLIKNEEESVDSNGLTESIRDKINAWNDIYNELINNFDNEVARQKELFGVDKRWWNQTI